jgi:hypothetical protein
MEKPLDEAIKKPAEENVPYEFFNMVLYQQIGLGFAWITSGALLVSIPWLFFGEHVSRGDLLVAIAVSSFWILLTLGLHRLLYLWRTARRSGYWMVAVINHLIVLGLVLNGVAKRDVISLGFAIFLSFLILLNIWSKDMLTFVKRFNGRCPHCRQDWLKPIRKKQNWECRHCGQVILWRLADRK